MSMFSRSNVARALAAMAVVAGLAAMAPEPVRAETSAGIVLVDGDRRHGQGRGGHWRGRGHDRHDHWRGHRGRQHGRHWHHRRGPRVHHHYYAPRGGYHYRQCQVQWSLRHGGYVRVCL